MTTLMRAGGLLGAQGDRALVAPVGGAGSLLARLHEECDRQVPFSQAKRLLREAASAIERLEGDLAKVTAELAGERAARLAR